MVFIIGFVFISIIGTLLHFTYEKSGHNKIVALFSAVNESTWEHIKMALTPAFIYSIVDGFYYGSNPNYFFAKLAGILSIIIVIPLIFYTFKMIFKKNILIIDILTFYVAIFVSEYVTYKILMIGEIKPILNYVSLVLLFIIFGFYLLLTIFPIKNKLFKDPITKEYGLKGHGHE